MIGPLGGIAVRIGGSKKVFPDFDPFGGLLFYDRVFGLRVSPTFLEPPPVAGVRSGLALLCDCLPSSVCSDKNRGAEPCHDFPLWTNHGARWAVNGLARVGPGIPFVGVRLWLAGDRLQILSGQSI